MFEIDDAAHQRRILHMHIKYRQENGDALAFAAEKFRLGRGVNRIHLAMPGRENEIFSRLEPPLPGRGKK